jgi:hypothetical protein
MTPDLIDRLLAFEATLANEEAALVKAAIDEIAALEERCLELQKYQHDPACSWPECGCSCGVDNLNQELSRLRTALERAITFIKYARYELEPGLATIGDQFPRQEDADKMVKEAEDALCKMQ